MNHLTQYINEKLQISSHTKIAYKFHPQDIEELRTLIDDCIKKYGENVDLNDIDVSHITDMSKLFMNSNFNGDISNWDVSNVKDMNYMFSYSKFNRDISKWNVSNVKTMSYIFYNCPLENNPPKWYKK